MNFNEYQKKAFETAIYPNKGNNIIYPAFLEDIPKQKIGARQDHGVSPAPILVLGI